VGSRERRLGVEELLAAVPRPRWQRDIAGFATLVTAVTGGLLTVGAAVTVTVLTTISYGGGRWPLSLLLVMLGWVTCLALGFGAGRLVPHRWTAPIAAFAVYLLSGVPTYLHNGTAHLAPVANLPSGDGQRLRLTIATLGAGWLLGLAATAFIAGSARHRRWALLPASLAVLAAMPLTKLPVQWNGNSYSAMWTEQDPGAMARVCSSGEPTVCVNAVHASLLPAVTRLARPVLAEMPPGSVAAERGTEHPAERPATAPSELPIPFLEGRTTMFSTELRDPDGVRADMVGSLLRVWCATDSAGADRAYNIANTLFTAPGPTETVPWQDRLTARLHEDPAARRAWLATYLAAARDCDVAALDRLAGS
jgi:hypothetical protein